MLTGLVVRTTILKLEVERTTGLQQVQGLRQAMVMLRFSMAKASGAPPEACQANQGKDAGIGHARVGWGRLAAGQVEAGEG